MNPAAHVPPVANRQPKATTLHGTTLHDEYSWLREKSSQNVLDYLNAENAFTEALMAPTAALQATLYAEMLSHIKETDESVPYPDRGFLYWTRTVEGKQYPIHCRKPINFTPGEEQILLDINELAEGQPFMSVGGLSVTPSGTILAYTTDNSGFRQYTLHIRDLSTGLDLPDTASRVGSVIWAADSTTLLYTTEDETTKRQNLLFLHTLGSTNPDAVVFEEPDERFNIGLGLTRDRKYILLESGSHTTNEVRFLPSDTPTAPFTLIAPRLDDQEYHPDHRDGLFFLRTNDTAEHFRLVTAPVTSPGRDHWFQFIGILLMTPSVYLGNRIAS